MTLLIDESTKWREPNFGMINFNHILVVRIDIRARDKNVRNNGSEIEYAVLTNTASQAYLTGTRCCVFNACWGVRTGLGRDGTYNENK